MKNYLEEAFIYKTMTQQTYDFLLKKYDNEIKTQREMLGSIRLETVKPHLNTEKFEYLQKIYEDYTCKLWFLFNFDAEQIETRNKK